MLVFQGWIAPRPTEERVLARGFPLACGAMVGRGWGWSDRASRPGGNRLRGPAAAAAGEGPRSRFMLAASHVAAAGSRDILPAGGRAGGRSSPGAPEVRATAAVVGSRGGEPRSTRPLGHRPPDRAEPRFRARLHARRSEQAGATSFRRANADAEAAALEPAPTPGENRRKKPPVHAKNEKSMPRRSAQYSSCRILPLSKRALYFAW